jgi:hypothetical protein
VLRFRDYQLKERLSEEFRFDPPGYTDSKSAFVQEINRKARAFYEES